MLVGCDNQLLEIEGSDQKLKIPDKIMSQLDGVANKLCWSLSRYFYEAGLDQKKDLVTPNQPVANFFSLLIWLLDHI